MQVLTWEPEARGPVSIFLPLSKISLGNPAYSHDLDDFTCSQRTSWQV